MRRHPPSRDRAGRLNGGWRYRLSALLASTIAVDTAQIVLLEEGLAHLDKLFVLAKQFNRNMNQTFAILLVPAALGLTGAFLWYSWIVQTVMLNMAGLALGLGNVMYPLIQNREKKTAAPDT